MALWRRRDGPASHDASAQPASPESDRREAAPTRRLRRRSTSRIAAALALSPAMLVLVVVYVGCTAWTIWISFTASRMLPNTNFVGLRQYASLMGNERW